MLKYIQKLLEVASFSDSFSDKRIFFRNILQNRGNI